MIPIQQLRIGNHFKWSDNTLIGTGTGIVSYYNMAFWRFMEGIPIKGNEQWLLDRGFYKLDSNYYIISEIGECNDFFLTDEGYGGTWTLFLIGADGIDRPISFGYKYIHQIQNLLHILTHKELTLK